VLTVKSGLLADSKPIDSGVDHAKILLEQSHGWTNVDQLVTLVLKLLYQRLAMRSEILKRLAIFQTKISIDD
jgi:hypothetical protein